MERWEWFARVPMGKARMIHTLLLLAVTLALTALIHLPTLPGLGGQDLWVAVSGVLLLWGLGGWMKA